MYSINVQQELLNIMFTFEKKNFGVGGSKGAVGVRKVRNKGLIWERD